MLSIKSINLINQFINHTRVFSKEFININLVFQTFPLVEAEQCFYALNVENHLSWGGARLNTPNVEIIPGFKQSKLDALARLTSMCT